MTKKDYKLAYEYIYGLLNCDDESMRWPLTINSMNIFKELVDEKINNPSLEEIKKEWEELGYKWFENDYKIELITTVNDFVTNIYLDKVDKKYCCFDGGTEEGYVSITIQEHQLLTKTFKALGWLDDD